MGLGYSEDEPLVLVDEDDPLSSVHGGNHRQAKGAVITHRNEMVLWMLGASFVLTEPGMSNSGTSARLRTAHISPGILRLLPVHVLPGATVVLPTKVFDPVYIMETIEKEKINALVLVPR